MVNIFFHRGTRSTNNFNNFGYKEVENDTAVQYYFFKEILDVGDEKDVINILF